MPLIKLTNQQIILVLGSNGYSSRAGKRPLGSIVSFIAGVGLTLLLLGTIGSRRSLPSKPSKPSRRDT